MVFQCFCLSEDIQKSIKTNINNETKNHEKSTKITSRKPFKNPSKTRSEPYKNRCKKHIVFQHRLFLVSALILEPVGPPNWSQVVQNAFLRFWRRSLGAFLNWMSCKNGVLGASRLDFDAPKLDSGGLDFSEIFAYSCNASPRHPAKNFKNAKNAKEC